MFQKESAEPPKPYGVLPSERQLKWHYETEFYGFIHFTINTFTDKEWGFGDENPSLFNPTMFDADKIVRAFKSAGMTGLILTCKHHDGFCLWPTKTTERSIKNSPWKDGNGDLVKEISDACRKNDMKFGVYVSPWDRSHKDFAKPGYLPVFREQLTELLTNYGPVFQVWWDGAVGKDGFYGGTREQRDIDRNTYFGFPEMIHKIVRKYQPEACVFTEVGPEIRWIGNESGWAGDPCWATFTPRYRGTTRELEINPETGEYFELPNGLGNYTEATNGHRNGKFWIPAETDVSIRPGWFWHKAENKKVKSLDLLLKIYFESVGRGTSLNLNVPPDNRGLINGIDSVRLEELGSVLHDLFATNLAASATVIDNSNTRSGFPVDNLFDGMRNTYWATDDSITTPDVILNFKAPITFDVVRIREFLPLGQRVDDWAVDSWQEGEWKEFAKGTAIGSCRLVRTNQSITTEKVRLRITKSPVCPTLAEFGLYKMPDSTIPSDD